MPKIWIDGVNATVSDHARRAGLTPGTVWQRYRYGWPNRLLLAPVGTRFLPPGPKPKPGAKRVYVDMGGGGWLRDPDVDVGEDDFRADDFDR